MMGLMTIFNSRITIYLLIGLFALGGVFYVNSLRNQNDALNKQNIILDQSLITAQQQIQKLNEDRNKLDIIIKENITKQKDITISLKNSQKKLRQLRNESKDTCLESPIDSNILSRLQHKNN